MLLCFRDFDRYLLTDSTHIVGVCVRLLVCLCVQWLANAWKCAVHSQERCKCDVDADVDVDVDVDVDSCICTTKFLEHFYDLLSHHVRIFHRIFIIWRSKYCYILRLWSVECYYFMFNAFCKRIANKIRCGLINTTQQTNERTNQR